MYKTIADFYKGKSIFLTGGTGFLGKVIIEKLLYSCSNIDKIYVLIRNQHGLSADQRIQNLIDDPLFARIRKQKPKTFKKLIPICGDVALLNLGLSTQDEELLIEKVSVVIHAAATVKFNEPLKLALKTNVEGTNQILNLCHRMKKLEVFVHTSTAYSNPDKPVVEERVYPPPADLDDVYSFIKEENEELTHELIKDHPNTYTFTKALAETLVEKQHGDIPTVIIRPSIVTAIIKDPVPGWICNWYGATGIVTAAAKGLTRIIYGDAQAILDLVPVDYVSNLIIASTAMSDRSQGLAVYNTCTSDCNPLVIGQFFKHFTELTVDNKTHVIPRPDLFIMTQCEWLVVLVTFFCQTLPAYFMDFLLMLQGRRAFYVKLQSLLTQSRDALSFFSSHSWIMRSTRARALASSLSPADREEFPYQPQDINWKEYCAVYYAGIRRFLEKKDLESK